MGKSDFSVKEDDGTTRLMLVRRMNVHIISVCDHSKGNRHYQ